MKKFLFYHLDLFAYNPKFKKYPTNLGLAFSILYLLILISTSIYFSSDITNKDQPIVQITNSNSMINLNKNIFNSKDNPLLFFFMENFFYFTLQIILKFIYQQYILKKKFLI